MRVFAVVTIHKGTNQEFIEGIFINEENAFDYQETIIAGLMQLEHETKFEVKIEPYVIQDWYDENEN